MSQSRGVSSTVRAEFDLIQAGFDLAAPLDSPVLTGVPQVPAPTVAKSPATKEYTDALALGTSGAAMWVSGTTYALGNPVISPINLQLYRRAIAGAGTTDPSLDPVNWVLASASPAGSNIFLATTFGAL